jgi:hypothetical protein
LYPVVAFTGLKHGALSEEDRDAIWRRWGVPVFEQLLSSDYEVLAEECEARRGLHLREECSVVNGELLLRGEAVGLAANLIVEPCPCRAPGSRIVDVGLAVALPVRKSWSLTAHTESTPAWA